MANRFILAFIALIFSATFSFAQTLVIECAASPTSGCSRQLIPISSTVAENSHILKTSAANLYSVSATNLTATAGFLVILNVTAVPADGAISPAECVPLPANGVAAISYNPGPPSYYSTGIVVVVTSAATCFTKTTGVITAFIKGSLQ